VAIFVGVVLFTESLSLLVAVGTVLILFGMALVTKRPAKQAVESPAAIAE